MQPPQHSATAQIAVIVRSDPAWDFDRALEELREIEESGGDATVHPLFAYHQGRTRYDLDAPAHVGAELRSPREYLKPGVTPVVWACRRLKISEVSLCRDMGGHRGQFEAFRLAVTGVSGVEGVVVPAQGVLRAMPERDAERIGEQVGATVLWEVGEAALLAAEAPTAAEKKP